MEACRQQAGAAGCRRVGRRTAHGHDSVSRRSQPAPFRLIYSVRTPEDQIYKEELWRRAAQDGGPRRHRHLHGAAPEDEHRPVGRISAEDLVSYGWAPELEPTVYVCGPTSFVESVSDLLVGLGHDPAKIKTERFGPSGP